MSQEKGNNNDTTGIEGLMIWMCDFLGKLIQNTDSRFNHIVTHLNQMSSRIKDQEDYPNMTAKNVPEFNGGTDPDAYIQWETEIDAYLEFVPCEATKVRLVTTGLTGYAIVWWTRRCEDNPVETWSEMKGAMRARFVPKHYYLDLYKKLHRLNQGSKTPEEYYREMEVMMIRGRIREDPVMTMARYLCGLDSAIANLVEMNEYDSVIDMVHQATKVYKSSITDSDSDLHL